MEGEAEDSPEPFLGAGQSGLRAEAFDHMGLLVASQRVVHRQRQSHGPALLQQPVALIGGHLDHVQVVAVLPVGAVGWQHHTAAS